jgi:hypothetical protein
VSVDWRAPNEPDVLGGTKKIQSMDFLEDIWCLLRCEELCRMA